MNERIRELALQVDLMRYPSDGINTQIEKFAELIVQECIFISRTSTDGFSAGRRMAERFGVRE